MKRLALFAVLLIAQALHAQTTTAYGITFPNAHPRLWWTSGRLTTAQAWVTANSYAGVTTTGDQFQIMDSLFTCYVGSGMGGTIGTNATTACANVITWAVAYTVGCSGSSNNGCDGARVYGEDLYLVLDWLYPGCGKASCLTSGNVTTIETRWDTYMQGLDGQTWGGIGMPGSNYFAGDTRNDILGGIAMYIDVADADTFLAFGANKTVNASTRWNDYQNAVALSPATPGGTVDTAHASSLYGWAMNEGSEYGRYLANYPQIALESAKLGGRDMMAEARGFQGTVLALIYNTSAQVTTNRSGKWDLSPWSDNEIWVNGGDTPSNRYFCDFMDAAAQEYSGIAIGKLARQYLATVGTGACSPAWLSVDPGGSTQAFSTLPLDYYAAGPQFMSVRDNWTTNATTMLWQLGFSKGGLGHFHYDTGNFNINRKGVWIAKESTAYQGTTIAGYNDSGLADVEFSFAHNVPIVGTQGSVNAGCSDGPGLPGRLETQTGYAFAEVDITKVYQNNVCDGSHSSSENTHVVSILREFYWFRGIDVLVVFDRFQNDLSTTSTTFLSHCETAAFTMTSPTATCIQGTQEAAYTMLIPAAPSMVDVNEHDNSATCQVANPFYECQHRLESTNANPGNVVNYDLTVIQVGDASGFSALTPSMVDSAPGTPSTGTFTVTIDGSDSLVLNKGVTSSGGTITAAGTTTSLITSVEGMTVTDAGPVWANSPGPPTNVTGIAAGVTIAPGSQMK